MTLASIKSSTQDYEVDMLATKSKYSRRRSTGYQRSALQPVSIKHHKVQQNMLAVHHYTGYKKV